MPPTSAWLHADGFGAAGDAARHVPPHAELTVEVEMLAWKAVQVIVPDGIVKKTLTKSSEWKVSRGLRPRVRRGSA